MRFYDKNRGHCTHNDFIYEKNTFHKVLRHSKSRAVTYIKLSDHILVKKSRKRNAINLAFFPL